jgi:ArsR family metal-binding transcriptional regulator
MSNKVDKILDQYQKDGDFLKMKEDLLFLFDVVKSLPDKYCPQCGEPIKKPHKFWCESKQSEHLLCECGEEKEDSNAAHCQQCIEDQIYG